MDGDSDTIKKNCHGENLALRIVSFGKFIQAKFLSFFTGRYDLARSYGDDAQLHAYSGRYKTRIDRRRDKKRRRVDIKSVETMVSLSRGNVVPPPRGERRLLGDDFHRDDSGKKEAC